MLDECVGGRRGRLLIDILDHTHCTYILHCLKCRHILGSFPALSLLCLRDDPSPLKVCNSHSRCTMPVSSVICCGFPLEVHLTLLQVGFQLVFVAFPLSTVCAVGTVRALEHGDGRRSLYHSHIRGWRE